MATYSIHVHTVLPSLTYI